MLSHLRIIFPIEADLNHLVQLDRHPNVPLVGKVWHKVIHWNGSDPAYAPDMDIHVGVERKAEMNFWGKMEIPPAQGLLRGSYLWWEQPYRGAPWGWLAFSLRYDIQEGPEVWAGDWHRTLHSEEPGAEPFCYTLEINQPED